MSVIDREWVVILHATLPIDACQPAPGTAEHLRQALRPYLVTVAGGDRRCSLEFRLLASTEAEALFMASARWKEAARGTGMGPWHIARAEVLPLEELGRTIGQSPPPEPLATAFAGEDLLPRALQDPLTGLVDRELFADRVRTSLAEDEAGATAVLVLDLDDFAVFNQAEGSAVADRLLAVLAARISRLPELAMVARLGGDEFAALIRQAAPGDAARVAARVRDAVRMPVQLAGRMVSATASVGIAASAEMSHPDDLLRDAAIGMCIAKAAGGDCVRAFDPGISVDVHRLDFDADPAPDRLAQVLLLERAAMAANECQDLESAARKMLQQVCTHTGWRLGHLGVAGATNEWLSPTSIWHISGPDHFEVFRRTCDATALGLGTGLGGQVLETGKPAWTADVPTDPSYPPTIRAAAAAAGIRSGFAFPILVGREVVAVLGFYSSRAGQLSESLTEVMVGVCAQLARLAERNRAQAALARTEEQYRLLTDSVPVLMWMADPDGSTSMLNASWLAFTGRRLEDELGDGWMAGVHPDDVPRCKETFARALKEREPFEIDFRLRRHDGEYRVITDQGRPIGIGDFFQGYVGACVDVTDRRRAEEAMRHSESRLEALLATSGAILTLLGPDGTVIADYQGITDGLGYDSAAMTGRLGLDFVHPDDLACISESYAATMASPGMSEPVQLRVRHADGTWRWVEAVANNLLDYPPVRAVVVSSTDITARKAAEAALAESVARLARAADIRPLGMWHRNMVTEESSWSDEMFDILGVPRGDLEGRGDLLGDAVFPADRPALHQFRASISSGQPVAYFEFRIVRPDGEIRRVRGRGMVVKDRSGTPVSCFGSFRDITDMFMREGRPGHSGAA